MRGTAQMTNKLNSIIIPHIEFRDTTIREAVDFLREQAAENDPSGQGVNIVLRLVPLGQVARPSTPVQPVAADRCPHFRARRARASSAGRRTRPGCSWRIAGSRRPVVSGPAGARITVTLDNIPLGEALVRRQSGGIEGKSRTVCRCSHTAHGAKQRSDHKAISCAAGIFRRPAGCWLLHRRSIWPVLVARVLAPDRTNQEAPVATNILEKEAVRFQTASGVGTGAGATSASNRLQGLPLLDRPCITIASSSAERMPRQCCKAWGLVSGRASATFWPHSGTLIVRNTQDNLDMVDALVDQANSSAPKQVEIESKFVEINQNNLKELGFDWLLGPV